VGDVDDRDGGVAKGLSMQVSSLPAVSFLGAKSGPAIMTALDGRKTVWRVEASDTPYSRGLVEMSPGPNGGGECHKYYTLHS
jgi:hypothetical protein